MTERPIRALIVDDEPLARRRIDRLLEGRDDVEVIGECANGRIAAETITEQEPDLVFLDIHMPDKDGFEALEAAATGRPPIVVFVTAYDEHALRAFEARALDYLLKPFDDERFERTLERAIRRIRDRESSELRDRLMAILDVQGSETRDGRAGGGGIGSDRLVVREGERIFFLKTEEIDWIEAADYKAKLHVGGVVHEIRESLTSLEEILPFNFARIHRSTIVNLDRVAELQPWFHGAYAVILEDGTELRLSRGRRKELEEKLGRSL